MEPAKPLPSFLLCLRLLFHFRNVRRESIPNAAFGSPREAWVGSSLEVADVFLVFAEPTSSMYQGARRVGVNIPYTQYPAFFRV